MARANTRSDRGRGAEKTDFPTVKLISCPVRLSYPSIFDPRENDQGQEVWETDALVRPDKEGKAFLGKLQDALYEVMEKHFGPEDEWPRGRNDYEPRDKIKYLDPDKLPSSSVNEDWSKFTARSYSPVGIVDADRNEVLNKREAYGGRWARLSLTVTVYDNKSKGPAIYLNNVQLLDNDESFGGRPRAEQEFDNWDGDDLSEGRDDRRESRRGREESRSSDDRGRGGGRGSRDDDTRDNRSRSRTDRDERDSDRGGNRDSRDSRGRDDRDSRGRNRDDDRSRDRGNSDRDRGSRRERGDERDSRPSERGSRDEGRGGRDRDERQDRRSRDQDSREDRGSRRSSGDSRDSGSRDRGGRDREEQDERPSRRSRDDEADRGRNRDRGRDRDDRDRDDEDEDQDWT